MKIPATAWSLLFASLAVSQMKAQIIANETRIYSGYNNTYSGTSFPDYGEQILISGSNALNGQYEATSTVRHYTQPGGPPGNVGVSGSYLDNAYNNGVLNDWQGLAYVPTTFTPTTGIFSGVLIRAGFYSIYNNDETNEQIIANYLTGNQLGAVTGSLGTGLSNDFIGLDFHDGQFFGLYNNTTLGTQQIRNISNNNSVVSTLASVQNGSGVFEGLNDGYTRDYIDIEYFQGSWYGLFNDDDAIYNSAGGFISYPDASRQIIVNLGPMEPALRCMRPTSISSMTGTARRMAISAGTSMGPPWWFRSPLQ